MFVINSDDKIEYVAARPEIVKSELDKLILEFEILYSTDLDPFEIFYYSALLHLVFVKIHPFQDGNGRACRLIEKWFLIEKIGDRAISVQSEKNYYVKSKEYYSNIRKIGLEYDDPDYSKSLEFLLMTAKGLAEQS